MNLTVWWIEPLNSKGAFWYQETEGRRMYLISGIVRGRKVNGWGLLDIEKFDIGGVLYFDLKLDGIVYLLFDMAIDIQ